VFLTALPGEIQEVERNEAESRDRRGVPIEDGASDRGKVLNRRAGAFTDRHELPIERCAGGRVAERVGKLAEPIG
jgi:hypothetical protein